MEQTFDTVDAQSTQSVETPLQDRDIVQGRIFWLPSREEVAKNAVKEKLSNEELWKREVMRGHSRGAIDERIYSHPVVIVSRPKSQSRLVHFLLITSFRGKTLDEIYDKPNDFHTSRRSWYLPVGPTPLHPDAQSAKTRKRFPTLALGNAALLRKNSYVDIRHIYQIDWSLLQEYTNLEHQHIDNYRFERESFIRMLAKCKTLTEYEPKEQLYKPRPQSRKSSRDDIIDEVVTDREVRPCRPRALSWDNLQPDFHRLDSTASRIPGLSPKVPPDIHISAITKFVHDVIIPPMEQICSVCHSGLIAGHQKAMATPEKPVGIKRSFDKFCRDAKGVAAITIATFF